MLELEPIDSLRSPGELRRFLVFLEEWVSKGELQEIPADPTYQADVLPGGRWFRVKANGSVWRLLLPDPPFTGCFERVRSKPRAV